MTATLAIVDGCRVGDVLTLTADEMIVGRQPTCDLVLPTASISRQHARLLCQDGAYYLEDLNSRNGTFVNGRRVSTAVRLVDRDVIQLFDVKLVFRMTAPEAASSSVTHLPNPLLAGDSGDALPVETVAEIDIYDLGLGEQHSNAETKLKAVIELTRNLQRGFDIKQLSPRVLESVFRIFLQASRGCLFYVDSRTKNLLLGAILERDQDEEESGTMRPVNRSVARKVLSSGKAILSVEPLNQSEHGAGEATIFDGHVLSFMCAPLIGPSQRPCGSIYVDAQEPATPFTENDLDVLATVAFLVGQAVEQLLLHTARYHAVVDSAVDGVITVDARGTIESVNPAIQRLFGYQPEELIGRNMRLLMPKLDGAVTTGDNLFGLGAETVARRKDGSAFPVHVSGGEFELEGQRHFTGILHDITERKRYESELKQLNQTLEQRVQQRTGHVRLLQDVAVIANEAESIQSAFQAALKRICQHMNWPVGHVFLRSRDDPEEFFDTGMWALREREVYHKLVEASHHATFRRGQGTVGRVIERRQAQWDVNLKDDSELLRKDALLECGIRTSLAFPLFIGEEIVGVVEFFSTHSVEPDSRFLNVMNHVGTQLGRVVERRYLQEDLIDAVWYQQRRFGQELHDSLGQELTGVGMLVSSLARKLKAENHPAADRLAELSKMVQQTKEGARKLSKGMFPVDIDAQGLRSALEEMAANTQQRYEVECVVACDREIEVRDNNVATHLFRIAQEAVTNAVKHGRPSRIAISLSHQDKTLLLSVEDDGCGFKPRPAGDPPGMGIRIMRYRANVIGASLKVIPNTGHGTTVRCLIERTRP